MWMAQIFLQKVCVSQTCQLNGYFLKPTIQKLSLESGYVLLPMSHIGSDVNILTYRTDWYKSVKTRKILCIEVANDTLKFNF